jgi:hypothetical protein
MNSIQGTPAPAAPPPPLVDGDAISRQVEQAIEQALSQAQTGQGGNVRQNVREAIAQARADIEAARAQGVERIVVQPPFNADNIVPPQAVDISIAFFVMVAFIIVGLPLARAFARRMDRRSEPAAASEIAPRLDRIEQAVEAIAIEIERVSEGQRYTTKAIADLRGLPSSNAASGWPAGAREPERVPVGETVRRP